VRAASGGHDDIVAWLIGRGVPIDALDPETRLTALLSAAAFGATGTVDQLLAKGASPQLKDASGGNALWYAAETDSTPSIVSLMLKRGLPVDGANLDGRTPLMHAAESCAGGNVRLLLEAGADARLKDRQGRTAFDFTPAGHGFRTSQCQVVKGLLGK
jgi:ankyrin repeat protein